MSGRFSDLWEMSGNTLWMFSALHLSIKEALQDYEQFPCPRTKRELLERVEAWLVFQADLENHLKDQHKDFLLDHFFNRVPDQQLHKELYKRLAIISYQSNSQEVKQMPG